jgi:hypothetical protein
LFLERADFLGAFHVGAHLSWNTARRSRIHEP